MDVQVTGKGIDLGEALQSHVRTAMTTGVRKYFDRGAEANVNFGKDGSFMTTEATVHLASGVFLAANGRGGDAYAAFDEAMEKLEKRVRRYKRRLKDHHAKGRSPLPTEATSTYVIQRQHEEPEEAPLVIAEHATSLHEMSVSDAVMQLEIVEAPVIVFRNAGNGALSVVHRRDDGNIGWIEAAPKG